jgi:hypothetical protein
MEEQRTGEPTMQDVGEHMKQDFAELRAAAERRRDEVLSQVRELVDQHPLAAVGAAFGAGYLLSGALLSRMTFRLALLGARWYAGRMVRDLVQAVEPGESFTGPSGGRA